MKNIETYLHNLRRYYTLRRRFGIRIYWLPIWRRRLKSMAKQRLLKNIILLENGVLIPVDATDKFTHKVWLRGILAPDLEWAIHRYIKSGTIAVDVGANLGFISVLMAERVGERGEVFAIESNPDVRPKIEKIFRINGLQNYRLFPCGCSDKKEEAYFYINRRDHSMSCISQNHMGLKVQLLPLDLILEDVYKTVSFIKIDVERHEPEVLAGARRTLQKHRPTIVFETGTHTLEQVSKIGNILTEMSYDVVGVLHEWGIESKELSLKMTPRSHCNVLALPKHNP
jgi:FkbM family methyltransferase